MITYLTIFNQGYTEFTMNNIMNYLKVYSSKNNELVLVALDESSYTLINIYLEVLHKEWPNAKSIKIKRDLVGHTNFAEFNTPAFIDIMHKKINVVLNQLETSTIVHFFDGDVVFFQDPTKLIEQELINNDIVFQQDAPFVHHKNRYHNYACAGNFSIKQNDKSKQFLKEVIKRLNPNQNDQEVMYGYLNDTCSNIKDYPHCSLHTYDQELFQNGYDAFQANWYLKTQKISVHANHMIGRQAKLEALHKTNAWFI